MIEQRLDKIENMLSQLIGMVGKLSVEQQEMKKEQLEFKSQLNEVEQKNENRHEQLIDRFQSFERDKDFIWEKTARNEREIGNLKRLF
ncbi:hypothetical protein H1D32_16315 [Anaerobacillus sp. CMMVII]|uniref:hypothetical protein n=1 Tax=Anaerobacillus sp. CMMVII TaxID=2755588 RepID=UPI0021B75EA3|nr:hypothetical protein [Anaerobacillus sp. CMMVII]MCT8139129.1 hypothetical protein [Anaerobacillus sp. CMMVII]